MIVLRDDEADVFVSVTESLDGKWSAPNQYVWSVPQIARFLSGDESTDVRKYSIEEYANGEKRVSLYTDHSQ